LRQLYKSRSGWQKKIVFPFVVAARKTNVSIRKSFVDAKEKNGKLFTVFALQGVARSTAARETGMIAPQ
jgi:hypothetical protein